MKDTTLISFKMHLHSLFFCLDGQIANNNKNDDNKNNNNNNDILWTIIIIVNNNKTITK